MFILSTHFHLINLLCLSLFLGVVFRIPRVWPPSPGYPRDVSLVNSCWFLMAVGRLFQSPDATASPQFCPNTNVSIFSAHPSPLPRILSNLSYPCRLCRFHSPLAPEHVDRNSTHGPSVVCPYRASVGLRCNYFMGSIMRLLKV